MDLVLASASPRRAKLLQAMGLTAIIAPAHIDESPQPDESPEAMACRLADLKARWIAERYPTSLVLAADTLVVLNDTVLGKPRDPEQALEMLRALRGREHVVHTGVAVHHPHQAVLQLASSAVRMRDYKDQEMDAYVRSGDPMDKAGAYACQHPVFQPVASYGNCYANVMGLPLCHVYRLLAHWQIAPQHHPLQSCPWALEHARCQWAEAILQADPKTWTTVCH